MHLLYRLGCLFFSDIVCLKQISKMFLFFCKFLKVEFLIYWIKWNKNWFLCMVNQTWWIFKSPLSTEIIYLALFIFTWWDFFTKIWNRDIFTALILRFWKGKLKMKLLYHQQQNYSSFLPLLKQVSIHSFFVGLKGRLKGLYPFDN